MTTPFAHPPVGTLRGRAARALGDSRLQRNVARSTKRLADARVQSLAALPDAAGLRERGRAVRADAIARLPELHAQLRARIEARGGHVHLAADPAAVARIVLTIARAHEARRVVKSKSMVSEEVGLGHVLEDAGIESLETDLGEYLVQLAGELPVHIIAPALHKSRQECAELLGAPEDTPAEALTALARRRLRERFLAADIGITGGNFLLADSGQLVIVTNEGNDRMCTSLPRVHIAIVGVEKIMARRQDLPTMLSLLTRSATGQKISVYVSLISGPRGPEEGDGPEEFHLVLLDNGRSRLRGTPYAEALYCIRCGACLNVCPVYRQIGGHAYGSVYPGPIGAVISPLLGGGPGYAELAKASSLCGACWEACPVGIHLHDHLVRLRQDAREPAWRPVGGRATPVSGPGAVPERAGDGHGAGMALRTGGAAGAATAAEAALPEDAGDAVGAGDLTDQVFRAWAWAWSDPRRYRAAARAGRVLQHLLPRHAGWLRRAPGPLAGWTATRDLPPVAARTFRERWASRDGRDG